MSTMNKTDIFYKADKTVKEDKDIKTKSKRGGRPRVRENRTNSVGIQAEYELFEDNVGDIIVVVPSTNTERTRVKYWIITIPSDIAMHK